MSIPAEGIWNSDRENPGHRWGEPVIVSRTRIERTCPCCGTVRVTMVLPRYAWREWRRPGEDWSWRGSAPTCRSTAA